MSQRLCTYVLDSKCVINRCSKVERIHRDILSLFLDMVWPSGTVSDLRIPPVAAVYQRQLSVSSLRGRLMSSSLRAIGEGLLRLIEAVVCLSCCAAGPLVRYRGQWMAA